MKNWSALFWFLPAILGITLSDEVLMLVPFGSISHKNLFSPIATALGSRGHNVTIVSVFKPTESSTNVNEIVIPAIADLNRRLMDLHVTNGRDGATVRVIRDFAETTSRLCAEFFKLGIIQSWLENSRHFDSVLIDSVMAECLVPVSRLLSPALAFLNTAAIFPWISYPLNIPTPYSFQPFLFEYFSSSMTFWQRAKNALSHVNHQQKLQWFVYSAMDAEVKKYFPQAKSIGESFQDISLVLVNSNPILTVPRPEAPNVINVGGLHCRLGKPLVKDLATFADSAKEQGFIYFSLGSIFDDMLTKEQISAFLNAFIQLKYKIIWRFKKQLDVKLPEHIMVVPWVPQQDVLAHPNIRAFVTHAGLLSLQEAFYNRVPTVTLPLFADQRINTAHLAQLNLTVPLKWNELDVQHIVQAIKLACEDDVLRTKVQKASKIIKDVSHSPLDNAVYWMEYIMRHKGGRHFAIPTHLSTSQYFMIDAIYLILGPFLIFIGTVKFFLCRKRKLNSA